MSAHQTLRPGVAGPQGARQNLLPNEGPRKPTWRLAPLYQGRTTPPLPAPPLLLLPPPLLAPPVLILPDHFVRYPWHYFRSFGARPVGSGRGPLPAHPRLRVRLHDPQPRLGKVRR